MDARHAGAHRVPGRGRRPRPTRPTASSPTRRSPCPLGVERTADQAQATPSRSPCRSAPTASRCVSASSRTSSRDAPVKLPASTSRRGPARFGRTVLVSSQPALLRMAAALDLPAAYPYGCTEQRISRARAELALRRASATYSQLGGARGRSTRPCTRRSTGSRRSTTTTASSRSGRARAATCPSPPGPCSSWPRRASAGYPVDDEADGPADAGARAVAALRLHPVRRRRASPSGSGR